MAELWAGPIIVAQMGPRETTNGDDQWQCGGIDLKFLWAGSVSWCVSVYLWAPPVTRHLVVLSCVVYLDRPFTHGRVPAMCVCRLCVLLL